MPTVYNKVTAGGNTLIDLSQDTVTQASHIMSGYVGHLADGTQVTGTGAGSSYTLLASQDYTVNTTSTSATSVGSIEVKNYGTPRNTVIFFVQAIDTEGIRSGYYYCTQSWTIATPALSSTFCYIVTRSDNGTSLTSYNSSYGVYCDQISSSGSGSTTKLTFRIRSKYHATYSKTINSKYTVTIYELKWPNNTSPYVITT